MYTREQASTIYLKKNVVIDQPPSYFNGKIEDLRLGWSEKKKEFW